MKKIAIHSVPRSGSTWLGEILNSNPSVKYCFQPLFSYKLKDFLNEGSSQEDINIFFDLLRESDDSFINQIEQRNSGILPRFHKNQDITHVAYKEVRYHNILDNLLKKDNEIKMILIVRNPVDVINSWVNAPKEFDITWNVYDELMDANSKNLGRKENFYGLNSWIKTTKKFELLSQSYPSQVFLLNYSTLKKDTIITSKKLFEFCELDFSDSTHDFIKSSIEIRIKDANSVFRGGATSNISLDDKIIRLIKKHVNLEKLSNYL